MYELEYSDGSSNISRFKNLGKFDDLYLVQYKMISGGLEELIFAGRKFKKCKELKDIEEITKIILNSNLDIKKVLEEFKETQDVELSSREFIIYDLFAYSIIDENEI